MHHAPMIPPPCNNFDCEMPDCVAFRSQKPFDRKGDPLSHHPILDLPCDDPDCIMSDCVIVRAAKADLLERAIKAELLEPGEVPPTTIFDKLAYDIKKCHGIHDSMRNIVTVVTAGGLQAVEHPPKSSEEPESRASLSADLDTLTVLLDTIEYYANKITKELG